MKEKIRNRIIALEYAHDKIELAKDYEAFLCESKDEDEMEIRRICLDRRSGRPLPEIRELFDYLTE